MKRIRWKAGVSPPTERITLLHLEIKKLKVSGIAPDNTIYNLHKKTHEEKAVVCLIYILNQRKYSDICKFHHKYVSFDLKQKVVFKRRFLPSVSLIVL